MEAPEVEFCAFAATPEDEISSRRAATGLVVAAHTSTAHRICKLDTRLTLCCSVRQPPQSTRRQECTENVHEKFDGPALQIGYEASLSMVTIRDVAKQSGFSSTTVSIVLNDAPLARYIPAVTKKR